jgi:ATP-dependent RNA helicase RhlE
MGIPIPQVSHISPHTPLYLFVQWRVYPSMPGWTTSCNKVPICVYFRSLAAFAPSGACKLAGTSPAVAHLSPRFPLLRVPPAYLAEQITLSGRDVFEHPGPQTKGTSVSFEEFDLPVPCLHVLQQSGISNPTPIQEQTYVAAQEGDDILGIAQTGTGKTLAFSLPTVCELAKTKPGPSRMLVLTPTRELAVQVHSVIEPLAKAMKLRSTCVYGGVGMQPQINALRRGADIIIATPGRLLDHIQQKTVRFSGLSILVFDEADRMLDMGFLPDIRRIVSVLPKDRQTLMFSATFPPEMAKLTKEFQRDPKRIEVGVISTPVDAVTQHMYTVRTEDKSQLLADVLDRPEVTSAIVFIRTKHRADRVAKQLKRDGFKAMPIHGGRSQNQRQNALDDFKAGKINILVATDVAARGIDIQGVTHVINFDIPGAYEDYVHRIGRTARAKAKGDAITFVSPDNVKELAAIEKGMGKPIPEVEWSGSITISRNFRAQGTKVQERKPARERTDNGPKRTGGGGAPRNSQGGGNRNAGHGAGRNSGDGANRGQGGNANRASSNGEGRSQGNNPNRSSGDGGNRSQGANVNRSSNDGGNRSQGSNANRGAQGSSNGGANAGGASGTGAKRSRPRRNRGGARVA